MNNQPYSSKLIMLIVLWTLVLHPAGQTISAQYTPIVKEEPITATNAADLRLLYLLDGYCDRISPDGHYMTLSNGNNSSIVEIRNGQSILPDDYSIPPSYSSDHKYVYVAEQGLFDLNNSQKRLFSSEYTKPVYSSDNRSAALFFQNGVKSAIQVYDTKSWNLRFAVEGDNLYKGVFSPNGQYIMIEGTGLYDAFSGKKLFAINPKLDPFASWTAVFDLTNSFVAIPSDGLYDVKTGERKFKLYRFFDLSFSADGQFLAIGSSGLYEVEFGKQLFKAPSGESIIFSPDGKDFIVGGLGVYSLQNRELRFAIHGDRLIFSPDKSLLAVEWDGVYNFKTGKQLFKTKTYDLIFSPDGSQLMAGAEVYSVSAGTPQFKSRSSPVRYQGFSPDGSLIIGSLGDLIDAKTGQRKFGGSLYFSPSFTPDGIFLVANMFRKCAVFALRDDDEAPGIIQAKKGVSIRKTPTINGTLIKTTTKADTLVIYARTPDSDWFRIAQDEWVKAAVVNPLYIPDELPVETG